MNDLVYVHNKVAVCDSLQVAEKFEKRHDKLLSEIERMYSGLIGEGCPQNGGDPLFIKSSYIHPQNKQRYPKYYMTRDGFTLLAMGFTGQKALEWKLQYINAFNRMESIIREKATPTWQESRKTGIETRKKETDTIRCLAEYVTRQGSKHPDRLYMTYTKLANKAAGIASRATATATQLCTLVVAESIISQTIKEGIEKNVPYKTIYQDCKKKLAVLQGVI